MDRNLTKEAGLVHRTEGSGGRPRYHQVVYRMKADREIFETCIEKGGTFRPSLLQKAFSFAVYEVNGERELKHGFTRPLITTDEVNAFTLHFTFHYTVSDPRALAESVRHDPLAELEQHAVKEIGGWIRRQPWRVIWEQGEEFLSAVRKVPYGEILSTPEEVLNDYAGSWGLRVLRVSVERSLPETAVAPDGTTTVGGEITLRQGVAEEHNSHAISDTKAELDSASELLKKRLEQVRLQGEAEVVVTRAGLEEQQLLLEKRKEKLELELDTELKALGMPIRLMGNLEGIIDRAAARVGSVPQLKRTLEELQGLKREVYLLSSPLAGNDRSLGPLLESNASTLPPARSVRREAGLGSVLEDFQIHLTDLSQKQQSVLVAPVLRILAGVMSGDEEEELEVFQDHLQDALAENLEGLGEETVKCLRRFENISGLKARLGIKG